MSQSERRIWNNKIRRRKELRKNLNVALLTACMVAILSFTAGGFLSNARVNAQNMECKYYKSISVKEGDSLWSIAAGFVGTEYENTASYIEEVKEINHLEDDKITAGNYLVIPYYSERTAG